MKKVLITGFDPFGGEIINPSFEAIKQINHHNLNCELVKLEVPTQYFNSAKLVIETIDIIKPDVILLVGQAGGRKDISIERIAINIDDSKASDNAQIIRENQPILKNGSNAYFSSLPINEIIDNLRINYIPANISNSAGTYVCNHLMYLVLNYLEKTNNHHVKAGFIHVPYIKEQTKYKNNIFSLDLEIITKALEIIIETTIK
jgi:pyroglutamyl-peptidase